MFSLSRLTIIKPLIGGIINLPQCQERAQTGGVGQIAFLRYKDGAGCGFGENCDFYFKPLQIQDEDGKLLKNIDKTTWTSDTDDVDLTRVTELQNPIQINITTNKTIEIVATVWDEDNNSDDFIREIKDFIVPFDTISVGDNWKPATKNIGTTVTFKVKYKLTRCDDNFTGLGCNFCKEHWNGTDCDSCATNYHGTNCAKFCNTTSTNYTCDTYGNRTCNNNYYPELQCNKYCYPVDKIYSCNQTTGDKICIGNRAGEVCEECLQNFYPQGECTVFCRPVQGQYTCSNTGDKQCVGNRSGVNCTSCLDNYYGSRCEKYCKENKFYKFVFVTPVPRFLQLY